MRAVDIFPWNDRVNTGLPEIDAQHRVLVGLLNELAGHIVSVTDFPDLNRILAELADYTVYHFASEDALWNRYITDEHERSVHRHWHENFTSTIARLRDEQSARPLAEAVDETVAFLARWLISHILQQDRYCAHVVTGMQQGMAPDAARADAAERMKGSSGLLTELLLSTYGALAANTVSLMRENTERKRVQASLHESEERFRTIVEQSPVGIILHRDGHVIQVNEAAVRMFRYRSLDDMLGTVVFDNIAPENRAEVQDLAHRRLRGEDAKLMYETVGLRRDGSRFPLVLAPRRMQTAEGPVIGAFLLDITERKRAEEVERTVSRTIKLLSRTNALLVRVPDEQALLDGACRMAVEVGGYLMAWVGYARDDAAKSVAPVAHYGYEAHYLEEAQLSWGDNAQGQGPTGRAIRTGRRMVSPDIEHSPALTPWRRAALLRGYKGTVSLPLPVDGKVVGALVIYSASTEAFGAEEVTLLEELAHDLAFGIQALRLREANAAAVRDLERESNKSRALLSNASDGVHVLDENGRLIEASDGRNWFTVELVEPNRTLVLRTIIDLLSGRSVDPDGRLPRAYADGVWSFNLRPADGGQTRLVARSRGKTRPALLTRPFGLAVGDPAHFIMQTRQFHGLRTRVGAPA